MPYGTVWYGAVLYGESGTTMPSILEITDGTTTIDLLDDINYSLISWNPAMPAYKDGGIFRGSKISDGRNPVGRNNDNIIDTIKFGIVGISQNAVAAKLQTLNLMLDQAFDYWLPDSSVAQVYLVAKADNETGTRYASIYKGEIAELSDLYSSSFATGILSNSSVYAAGFSNLSLVLEHGMWLANPPGTGECVQVSNQQVWDYGLSLAVVSTTPTSIVNSFTRHGGSGAYYASAYEGRIMKSADGITWVDNLTGAPITAGDAVTVLYTLASNTILAALEPASPGPCIIRTTDDGATWTDESEVAMWAIWSLHQSPNGSVLAGGLNISAQGGIWRSVDDGATWTQVFFGTTTLYGNIVSFVNLANGNVLALVQSGKLLISTDNGATWTTYATIPQVLEFVKMILASDGNLYVSAITMPGTGYGTGVMLRSTDSGLTWGIIQAYSDRAFQNFIETSTNGVFYALISRPNTDASIWLHKSIDYGVSWQEMGLIVFTASAFTDICFGLYQAPDSRLFIGTGVPEDTGAILRTGISTTTTLGRAATCTDEVIIANNYHLSNVTHIYRDDGGTFTGIFPATLPVALFPTVPANNDALYIGTQIVTNCGPFNNLIFDIGTVLNGTCTLTPEYWNGGAWATLTVVDNTAEFTAGGVNSIHWTPPSGWASGNLLTILGGSAPDITGWWIRFRISGISGSVTPPTQQNRNIYIANRNCIDIDSLQVLGDIPAIARIKLSNISDNDGPGGNAPNFYSNRIIAGLRSISRGSDFVSIINIADEQNPTGVSVSLGANTTFASSVTTPAGRRAVYNPAGVEVMASRATVIIDNDIAAQFYGTYHVFLRAQRSAGASTDLSVCLQVATGSGGISFTTPSKQLQTTTAFEILDFGEITLPVSSSFRSTDLADTTTIAILASAASGTPNLYLYDLVLIPVDEWAIDAVDKANGTNSDVGRSSGISKLLDIDSVSDSRVSVRSLVRAADSNGFITAEYKSIGKSGVILKPGADQRLWFFAMQTSATGSSYSWLAPPEICHSIQVFANERYKVLRGAS